MVEVARKNKPLGDLLIEAGLIDAAQLTLGLAEQKKTGNKLGKTLIKLALVKEDDILKVLSNQLNIPLIDLSQVKFDNKLVKKLPESQARRFRAVVLEEKAGQLLIGMSDPSDIFMIDQIARIVKQPIQLALVREGELLSALDIIYRQTDKIANLAGELDKELKSDIFDIADIAPTEEADAPVIKLLQRIFEDAAQMKASDIHIEPDESSLRIRQRIDGILHEQVIKEKRIASALVLRLKLMCGLNISEKRLPQDGRFSLKVKDHNIDVRLSTMPVEYGESVVMRLLDHSGGGISLDDVGMPAEMLKRFRRYLHRPHGLILVTGPTGSGKTTTLYGGLQELNSPEKKIITVEDPVEYRLHRINQVQVNTKVGLTFASVLRAALRQDPDIILVGEIRDHETAEIALRAAMTGHLVLSTLHTNDAITSAMRLIDVGVPGYLAAAALRGVVAQRLVRRICESCKQDYEPDAYERSWLTFMVGEEEAAKLTFKKGAGCTYCNNTGFHGRIGVFEFLEISEAMTAALRNNDAQEFSEAAKKQANFRSLMMCTLDYANLGITALEEVFRVAEQIEDPENNEMALKRDMGEEWLNLRLE